jgi:hypothetical protein
MVLGTVVFLVCSFGQGGCGADGGALDATRPQDLARVQKFEKCYQSSTPGEDSPDHLDRCCKVAGISKIVSNSSLYNGRWVSLDGKPITVVKGPYHDR